MYLQSQQQQYITKNSKNKPNHVYEYTNSIKKYDFFSKNEISVSESIKKIPFFSLFFEPLFLSKKVKMAEIDEERFEKCDIIQHKEYILFQYKRESRRVLFADCFRINIKQDILHLVYSFQSLLKSIQILNENHIIHLNIHPNNIFYRSDKRYIMTDFFKAIANDINSIDPLLSHYNPANVYWPIELHILCYINERNQQSISQSNLEEICDDVLRAASLSPLRKYINFELKDADAFQPLINKSKNSIRRTIRTMSSTWNNYSLSIMYLHLISFLEGTYGSHIFFQRFSRLLIQNTHLISSKRETSSELFADIVDSISEQGWNQLLR